MAASSELREQLQGALGSSYTLRSELGGGGMSRVFVADEPRLGRKVVVKVLAPDLAAGVSVERFEREILLAGSLQQANIVPVLTAGQVDGLAYYTMPFVEGDSLRARLAAGPLSIAETVNILRDVTRALACAHRRGIVHRDIKPDNVLLSEGAAMVTDFGIARALAASRTVTAAGTLTQIGTSIGTPAYMAPEQVLADPAADHRVDVYAVGAMAYELLAGHPPFHGRATHQLLAAHLGERPEPIGALRPDAPPALADLVMRCLEKDPARRPQSAAELLGALDAVTSGGTHTVAPVVALATRSALARAIAAYAAVFLAVAVLAHASIAAIGLPEWVFPGTLIIMAMGLPVILLTALVHHQARMARTVPRTTPGGTPARASTVTELAIRARPHVTWRRAALAGALGVGGFALLVAGYMLLRALGIGPAGSLLATGRLEKRERLLVTDFAVGAADTSLSSVLSEAVRTDLGESPVISIVPPATVADALQRMRRPTTGRVDLALARDIAAREGIRAIVDGTLTPLAGGYIVTLRLVAAESGEELASFRESVDGPRALLPAIDRVSRRLRGKIGESLRSVHASPPLEQVTTSSLAALRKYAEGARANDVEVNYPKAIELLQEAVALDTSFAMAYRKLGIAMSNAEMPKARTNAVLAKAYRYRDRLPERERLLAIGAYNDVGPGHDRPRAMAAYAELLDHDSLDGVALNNLALLHWSRREFAAADSLYARQIRYNRNGVFGMLNLVPLRIDAGQLAAARAAAAAARARLGDRPMLFLGGLGLRYDDGRLDSAALARLAAIRAGEPDPQVRSWAVKTLGAYALVHGKLAEGERLTAELRASDSARGAVPPPLAGAQDSARVDIWLRERPDVAARLLDSALAHEGARAIDPFERPEPALAALYARAGRPDRARELLARYDSIVRDSAVLRAASPLRHDALAEVALAERRPLDAVRELRLADALPDGPADACTICLSAALGRAYDQADMPDSAIASYERYIDTPYSMHLAPDQDALLLAGIHERLGELYETRGDRARASTHYAAFVSLWSGADPELQPRVADVRRRLSRLQRGG